MAFFSASNLFGTFLEENVSMEWLRGSSPDGSRQVQISLEKNPPVPQLLPGVRRPVMTAMIRVL